MDIKLLTGITSLMRLSLQAQSLRPEKKKSRNGK
jgi:hypothetical protein